MWIHHSFSHMNCVRTILSVSLLAAVSLRAAPEKLRFNRDVRAILAENCFQCHGPDAKARKAKLRLDVRAEALKERKGGAFAIVPGDVEESELVYRIFADDVDEIMPPPESKLKLTAAQKTTLKQWVAEGAEYEPHWAYVRPRRAAVPKVTDTKWGRNAVDRFILAALEQRGAEAQVRYQSQKHDHEQRPLKATHLSDRKVGVEQDAHQHLQDEWNAGPENAAGGVGGQRERDSQVRQREEGQSGEGSGPVRERR